MGSSRAGAPPVAVDIQPYDPGWPGLFAQERARLARVFAELDVAIEHIGSTAIPDMAAKPLIDILLGAASLSDIESRIPGVEAIGYRYVAEHESEIPERRYFRKPVSGPSTHHLHCVVLDSDLWRRHLLFRDYLREHADVAADYASLKTRLAEQHRSDRRAYTAAKSTFIESIIARAEHRDESS